MIDLVTKEDLGNYKYVADSIRNAAFWPMCVREAQLLDVKVWLGDALLNELLTQSEEETLTVLNNTLLSGGTYVYQTKTYLFQGLKAAIIYYAFSRFTSRMPYNYTQSGLTVKDSDYSTPASDKAVQRLSTEAMLTAASIRDEVLLYLKRNSNYYPLFQSSNNKGRPQTFFVIGD